LNRAAASAHQQAIFQRTNRFIARRIA
jgi:hypothetical protein